MKPSHLIVNNYTNIIYVNNLYECAILEILCFDIINIVSLYENIVEFGYQDIASQKHREQKQISLTLTVYIIEFFKILFVVFQRKK